MTSFFRDVRQAARRLLRSPGFTLFAIASLALGLGVSIVSYSAMKALMRQEPVAVPDAEGLVGLRNGANREVSWPDFQDLLHRTSGLRVVAASSSFLTAVGAGNASKTVFAEAVSSDYFTVVQVRPRLGRLFDAADQSRAARVVVVSESFWKISLAGDPAIVGRSIKIGGAPFEVVGVIDGRFRGLQPFVAQSVWLPATSIPHDSTGFRISREVLERRNTKAFEVWGRLRRGQELSRASAEVAVIGSQLDAAYPPPSKLTTRQWTLRANAAASPTSDEADTIVFMMFAGIASVLLIACTNLANLTLANETARAMETAVRSALGASRWRLMRQQLIESALIVVTGGLIGMALARACIAYQAVDIPWYPGVSIRFPQADASLAWPAIGGMALALMVFGLWPALQSTRVDLRSRLGAGGAATVPKWRLHRTIIAWQVCGSVALLLIAMLSVKILTSMGAEGARRTTHGNLSLVQIDFSLNGRDERQMRAETAAILDGVRSRGAVRAVAAANGLPFGWLSFRATNSATLSAPDRTAPADSGTESARTIAVTPSFFPTANVGIVAGRAFTSGDEDTDAPPVAILSEAAARSLFHTINVVGRTVLLGRPPPPPSRPPAPLRAVPATDDGPVTTTIVGISRDETSFPSSRKPEDVVFVPFSQRYVGYAPITFVASGSSPALGVRELTASVRAVDPDLAISLSGTGAVLLDGPLFVLRGIIAATALLGLLALVLSMTGLFGVLSHLVSTRTRELGVRIALGAERRDILRLVLGDGCRPVAKGLVLGLVIGAGARVAVRSFVVTNVSAFDPWPFLLLPLPFIAAALAAAYLPAARAASVDPNVALRDL